MKVLVDTSVWSLALRRRSPAHPSVDELRRLIVAGRAAIISPVRQELLSGIRGGSTFERLRDRLGAFPDELLTTADYERAAEFFNACRAKGLQGFGDRFPLGGLPTNLQRLLEQAVVECQVRRHRHIILHIRVCGHRRARLIRTNP